MIILNGSAVDEYVEMQYVYKIITQYVVDGNYAPVQTMLYELNVKHTAQGEVNEQRNG